MERGIEMKKHSTLVSSALVALTVLAGIPARADNFVTITPTAATVATVTPRWPIGPIPSSNLSGLAYVGGNLSFTGATGTNFYTITGATIPGGGSATGFTSYLPGGTATPQPSVGGSLTADSYSGLTFVAENLSLIGANSFYAIHHRGTTDYLALIQQSVPTASDQKPMSIAGGPLTLGGSGYFALTEAADDPGLWGAHLFYYLRTDPVTGHTWFGSMIPALLSGPTDRYDLGLASARGYTDLAYTSTNVGFGFGASQFYYLRLDPVTQTTFFGRLNPTTGVATDIQNLGGVYRTLVFTTTDVGYGANNFYSIGRLAQTVTFGAIPGHTACDVPFTFVAPTASSSLPVTVVVTSGPATVAGNTVTLTGAVGTVVLTASQAGDSNYAPAPNAVQSFAVVACALTPQTITFAVVADRSLCDGAFAVAPTASSGLTVALAVTSGPATVSGNTVTVTGTGNVTLQATQAGNATYGNAPAISRTFAVTACAQTITFAPINNRTACDAPFTFVAPVATSGLPVTLAVSGPATVSGNTVTLTGAVGTVVITASQAGNSTYAAASNVAQSFVAVSCGVPPPTLTAQTIPFASIPNHTTCDAPFTFVAPVATSGLPVTLAVSGPASVSGNTVTLTGAVGTVLITASQAGNSTFSAAPSATQSFVVGACCVAPVILNSPMIATGTVGTPFTFTIVASGSPTSFTAFNLQPGLVLNSQTGVISGTPTRDTTTFVTLTATNGTCTSPGVYLMIVTSLPGCVPPVITNSTLTATGALGVPFSYTITASGSPTSYGAFNLQPGLVLNTQTGVISGTPTRETTTFVTLTASSGTCTSPGVYLMIVTAPVSRIAAFSARALSGPGDQTLIVGFAVSGSNKNLLVRGIGPTLASFGLSNVLADPLLTLLGSTGTIATNDDWQINSSGQNQGTLIAATAAQVGAFALPNGSKDSALLATVNSGIYTTSLFRPNSTAGGIALTEIYDTDLALGARLLGVSARMNVTTGDGALIAGLVIAGNAPKTVLIRGVGPTLATFGVTGVLVDPQIAVFSGSTQIASNDNWGVGTSTAAQIASATAQVGDFPLPAGSKDAALLVTLQPGSYTVVVTGVGNTTGNALVEIYDTQ
jgi:hypothetical protein